MSLRPLKRRRLLSASAIGTTSLAAGQRKGMARQEASPMASPVATPIVSAGDLALEHIALLTGSDPLSINDTDAEYGIHGTDLGSSSTSSLVTPWPGWNRLAKQRSRHVHR